MITFEEQLMELINKVEITPAKYQDIQNLYSDLHNCLRNIFPDCKIEPYGSAITGLAFEDSDVDCFISVESTQMKHLSTKHNNDLHSHLVNDTKNILRKHKRIFKRVTNCDVSFKNRTEIYNSQLIYFLIASDPRLKPLFQFIKYWNKNLSIGSVSSYALVLLIIFYLQQTCPRILIPIKELQRDKKFDLYVDDWNCGFDNLSALPKTQNTSSVFTLLRGFYHFYEDYDFADNVICPFAGKSFRMDDFNKLDNLLPDYQRYVNRVYDGSTKHFLRRGVNVQDVFEHSRNVNITVGNMYLFKGHCQLAYNKINNAIDNNEYDNIVNALLNQELGLAVMARVKTRLNVKSSQS
ncbi:uncharacterized protein LOC143923132 [Arctopsyche grandis]|uniref:uncharacterized protein LOC143923132 n=1 Tax=Arctopsyche grandis TaxID=121162 RepID=UPI00406D91DE